ncbi:hypothetical protein JYU34_005816 [Plutella xylostella]|uniref:Uncharacterized protein n=1 Tax=Plutella xylostella TaxID=51655 RepID=A0ABQ7QU78_PLUXY|nr:hypothetical protein JYU34_005816 [Plutella xylostella]
MSGSGSRRRPRPRLGRPCPLLAAHIHLRLRAIHGLQSHQSHPREKSVRGGNKHRFTTTLHGCVGTVGSAERYERRRGRLHALD